MARKPDIQYIEHFFVPGSEAPQLQPKHQPERKPGRTVLPKVKPEKKLRILVDPVALAGLVVAITMLVLMGVGMMQYDAACQEQERMEDYVSQLQHTNTEKRYLYSKGYEIDVIREQALALGMIPKEEAATMTVSVTVPQPEPEPTAWEEFIWFLEGLFA